MAERAFGAAVIPGGGWAGRLDCRTYSGCRAGDRGRDRGPPAAESQQPQFLLLIRETAATLDLESRVGTDAQVREYSAWAGSLAQAGQLVAAEKLADDGTAVSTAAGLPVTGQAEGAVSGFFLIRAADAATARAIAEASPHVRYGGVVEVRPIDAT